MSKRLGKADYHGDTQDIAQQLLGCLFVRQWQGHRLSGIIVETEAYLAANDPASHSFVGPKQRNQAMFQAAGTLYVYAIHAKYCLNVVTEPVGIGAAVLIRALQPWEGIETMQAHRQSVKMRELCTGPGRLCQALAIAKSHDQTNLVESNEIWIEQAPSSVAHIKWQQTSTSRIGISSGQELPYRYFIDGHECVSGLARLHQAKRNWRFTEA